MFTVLTTLDLPNVLPMNNIDMIQRQWLDRQMTTFDYLMEVNKLAGRSVNDLMQYPIFPFILAQYNEETLNLEDPKSFR